MEQAYFSNIQKRIVSLLDTATDEVIIAMAWFTSNELFDSLLKCLDRNVTVELILLDNATNFMGLAPDFNRLIEAGGSLRIATLNQGFMHHKFCVIDNRIAITGSYNWTYSAENRNIENILVTDCQETVELFKTEFKDLMSRYSEAHTSPRLSLEEVGNDPNIDLEMINYEIENISKIQKIPIRKVIKTSTSVSIEEKPINPISRYNIGVIDNHGIIEPIINVGDKLPKTSSATFYNHIEYRSNLTLGIYYGQGQEQRLVSETPITEITGNRRDDELEIRIEFTLVQSGDLIAEVRRSETKKVICVKAFNSNFISYED